MSKTQPTPRRIPVDETHAIEIPPEIPVIYLVSQVVYPFGATLVQLRTAKNLAVLEGLGEDDLVAVAFAPGQDVGEVKLSDLRKVGVAARVIGRLRLPDGSEQVTLQGFTRLHLEEMIQEEPFLIARTACVLETIKDPKKVEELVDTILTRMAIMVRLGVPGVEQEHVLVLQANREDPGRYADLVAAALPFDVGDRWNVLAESSVDARIARVNELVGDRLAEAQVRAEFDVKVKAAIGKSQREFYLRRQLKLLREELGETTPEEEAANEAAERLRGLRLPDEARTLAERQIERLRTVNPASAEFAVIQNHLDWLLSLPWGVVCPETIDVPQVRAALDRDHYGLEEAKERILEHLAVHALRPGAHAPVLCFVGPPGTGKTSLAQSIAGAIGRTLARISVGGVRDEAEIRGHRRTYVGALPGRIVNALRQAKCANPLLVIDEIDKMGGGMQGDPRAAMLEVLDPEQNDHFRDHYLDCAVDLSQVFFVTTANDWWSIPAPLRDRMEGIAIESYVEEEKIEIARRHLVPRAAKRTGLPFKVRFDVAGLRALIRGHTRESGVRQLFRSVDAVFRKLAMLHAEGRKPPRRINAKTVRELLGPPDFASKSRRTGNAVGVVNGLAWTPVGGDVLTIEAVRLPGAGGIQVTGSLGEVMRESVQAALTYIRARADGLGVPAEAFTQADVHVHFPEGAVPKDGPSAGIAIATAFASIFTGLPVRGTVAMTGEITLRGDVLPVGGLREKLAAALRLGFRKVLVPAANRSHVEEMRSSITERLEIVFVEHADEVLAEALVLPRGA